MALIEGLKPAGLWRAILFVAGLFLYRGAIRFLVAGGLPVVRRSLAEMEDDRPPDFVTLFLAGGINA